VILIRRFFFVSLLIGIAISGTLFGQYKSKYPDIPIVDVHIHPTGVHDVSNFLKVSEIIKHKYGSNLAYWVNLGDWMTLGSWVDPSRWGNMDEWLRPGDSHSVEDMKTASQNRMLFAVSQISPHKGLTITAEEVAEKVRQGDVGLKFWFGDPRRVIKEGEAGYKTVDDPYFENFFSSLERANVLMASFHIADPNGPYGNRQIWMANPVDYWTHLRAFENVVAKYPKLTIVAAHGAWLVCQDAQLDYLRYMLSTYPNLYIDIAATFQYMSLLNPDNIRDFYIEFQDRIVYGTDGGRLPDNAVERTADRYANTFAILETDMDVSDGFFGNVGKKPIKGLNLPREILEKIYYKNAVKLYPGLKEKMSN